MAEYFVAYTGNPGFIPAYPQITSRTEKVLVDGIPMHTPEFRTEQVNNCAKLDDNYIERVITNPFET